MPETNVSVIGTFPALVVLPLLIATVLVCDSRLLQDILPFGQVLASVLTVGAFLWLLGRLSPERRIIVLCFLAVAVVGECLFSLVFRLYEYRLEIIPIYVPFGHPMLLVMAWALMEVPWLQRNEARLAPLLGVSHTLIILVMFLVWQDTLSLAFAALGLYLFRRRRFTLVYGLMAFIVLALELVGTWLGCWQWASTSAGGWLHSTNPPFGAFFGYVAADIASIKLARRCSKRWQPDLQIAAP